jgi:hypothetical protein
MQVSECCCYSADSSQHNVLCNAHIECAMRIVLKTHQFNAHIQSNLVMLYACLIYLLFSAIVLIRSASLPLPLALPLALALMLYLLLLADEPTTLASITWMYRTRQRDKAVSCILPWPRRGTFILAAQRVLITVDHRVSFSILPQIVGCHTEVPI